jgi:glycosyltransferase involved in cell wall biosynthesis
MRILLLTYRYAPSIGGVERQCSILANELARRGLKTFVVTDRYLLSLPYVDSDNGIVIYRIWSLSFIRRFFDKYVALFKATSSRSDGNSSIGTARSDKRWPISLLRHVYRLIFYKLPILSFVASSFFLLISRRNEYDIIQVLQTHWLAYPAVVAGKILRKPVVACEAGFNGIDLLDDFPFRRHTKRVLLKYCNFVALSTAIQNNLRARGVPPERITVIPNSVPLSSGDQESMNNPLSVLFVGNVLNDPLQKGLDILLRAWQHVLKDVHEARLTIVGAGDFSEFMALAGELEILGSVNFLGVRTDIIPLYLSHNIFVLPSRSEGMSIALLEAMSCGRACLVTAVSGSDDLIENGVNGMKVEPENVSALSDALKYLLEHESEAKEFGKIAQERVRMHHSPEKISEQYIELYTKLLMNSSD